MESDPNIARIDPVPVGVARPLWSVMIPTYNCAKYLRQTLRSVLTQDPGPEQMQIEVVDDCSTEDEPEAVVYELGKGRVNFYRKPQNEGITANFNTCLERSRGHLIHILHGDDYIASGFYRRVADAAQKLPNTTLIATRCFVVNESNEIDRLSDRVKTLETPSSDCLTILYRFGLYAPGIVVRRSFYEQFGGFNRRLRHTADWEMCARAVAFGAGFFINEPLAFYRYFAGNDTGKLARSADDVKDILQLVDIFPQYNQGFRANLFKKGVAARAYSQYLAFREIGDPAGARQNYAFWKSTAPLEVKIKHMIRRVASLAIRSHNQ